jgi:hypothetical protein
MKRTSHITLGVVAGMALAFTSGCRSAQHRDCVDANNRIVNDQACNADDDKRRQQGGGMGYGGYHWIYGGSSGGRVGDAVVGGSATPSSGAIGGVSRGGFGGTGDSGGAAGSGGE